MLFSRRKALKNAKRLFWWSKLTHNSVVRFYKWEEKCTFGLVLSGIDWYRKFWHIYWLLFSHINKVCVKSQNIVIYFFKSYFLIFVSMMKHLVIDQFSRTCWCNWSCSVFHHSPLEMGILENINVINSLLVHAMILGIQYLKMKM